MIFIMSLKNFLKNKKKLVSYSDYIILDGTDDEGGDLRKFSGVVTVDGFNPPSKLLTKKRKKYDDVFEIDDDKVAKLERKFFKGKGFKVSAMGAIRALLEADRDFNVFVVLNKKAYKHYGKKMVKQVNKLVDSVFDIAYNFEDLEDSKKLLKKSLKRREFDTLNKKFKKVEKSLKED